MHRGLGLARGDVLVGVAVLAVGGERRASQRARCLAAIDRPGQPVAGLADADRRVPGGQRRDPDVGLVGQGCGIGQLCCLSGIRLLGGLTSLTLHVAVGRSLIVRRLLAFCRSLLAGRAFALRRKVSFVLGGFLGRRLTVRGVDSLAVLRVGDSLAVSRRAFFLRFHSDLDGIGVRGNIDS